MVTASLPPLSSLPQLPTPPNHRFNHRPNYQPNHRPNMRSPPNTKTNSLQHLNRPHHATLAEPPTLLVCLPWNPLSPSHYNSKLPIIQIMFQHTRSTELSSRRQSLLKDLRNTDRQSIKKRARTQLIRFLSEEDLHSLINKPLQTFSKHDLAELLHFANSQFPLAVAHLGNLLLDGVVKVPDLANYQMRLGFHPHWLWLIEVLIEQEYCTIDFLQHCIKALSPNRSPQTIKKALTILYKITLSGFCSLEPLKTEAFVLAVLNSCLQNEQYREIAFALVYELLRKRNMQQLQAFMTEIVRTKLVAVLSHGSLCSKRSVKLLSCKVASQLTKKGVELAGLRGVTLRLLGQAKEYNLVQKVLELLLAVVHCGSEQYLCTLLEEGLLAALALLKQQLTTHDHQADAAALVHLAREIDDRMARLGDASRAVRRELQRLRLLRLTDRMDLC